MINSQILMFSNSYTIYKITFFFYSLSSRIFIVGLFLKMALFPFPVDFILNILALLNNSFLMDDTYHSPAVGWIFCTWAPEWLCFSFNVPTLPPGSSRGSRPRVGAVCLLHWLQGEIGVICSGSICWTLALVRRCLWISILRLFPWEYQSSSKSSQKNGVER